MRRAGGSVGCSLLRLTFFWQTLQPALADSLLYSLQNRGIRKAEKQSSARCSRLCQECSKTARVTAGRGLVPVAGKNGAERVCRAELGRCRAERMKIGSSREAVAKTTWVKPAACKTQQAQDEVTPMPNSSAPAASSSQPKAL